MPHMRQTGRAAAWLASVVLFAAACTPDAVTAPSKSLAPSVLDSPGDQPGGMLGPVKIPIPETNLGTGTVGWMGTGMKVPAYTSFLVTVSGTVDLASNPKVAECWPDWRPPYGAEGSYGPLGRNSSLAVGIGFQYELNGALGWLYGGVGGDGGSTASSDTVSLERDVEVWVSRSGLQYEIGGGADCPPQGFYLMSGNQTISVQMLDGVGLQVNPTSAIVKKGTKVQFTATSNGVIVSQPTWRFIPKEGVTNETTGCSDGSNPCTLTINNDGELRVSKYLMGRFRSAKADVGLTRSPFTLVADKAVIDAGETVTFTPMVDGQPVTAARWLWRAADGTETPSPCEATELCQYAPATSGTMTAFRSTGPGGEQATASVTVKEKPQKVVKISAERSTMKFSTLIAGERLCRDYRDPVTQKLTISVVDRSTGETVPNQVVDLKLANVAPEFPGGPDYGGHYWEAHRGSKPTGELSATQFNTGPTGEKVVVYTASVFGGRYEVAGSATGAEAGADTIAVGMQLEEYYATPYDELVGQKGAHKYNHFLTLASMARVHVLTQWYNTTVNSSYKLELNDMSLEHGGKFDVDGNWQTPHCDHLDGRGIDLRTIHLPGQAHDEEKIQKQWLSENFYMRQNGELKLPFVPEGTPPHLHLKTWPEGAIVVVPKAAQRSLGSVAMSTTLPIGQGSLRVALEPTASVARGDALQFSYTARNSATSTDSVDFIVLDAPVRPRAVTGAPVADWWTGTTFGDRQVAAWGFIESHLPAGTTSPVLSFEATGVPGIVKYWVLPVIAPDSVMDVADSGSLVGAPEAAKDSGYTVGIVPAPSDNSPEANVARADGLAADACTLGWIDNAGVCNSIRVKIRAQSWGALKHELDAQRGKHVNETAYFLLFATAQRLGS